MKISKNFMLVIICLFLVQNMSLASKKYKELPLLETSSKENQNNNDKENATRAGQSNFSDTVVENIVIQGNASSNGENNVVTETDTVSVEEVNLLEDFNKDNSNNSDSNSTDNSGNTSNEIIDDAINNGTTNDNIIEVTSSEQQTTQNSTNIPQRVPIAPLSNINIEYAESEVRTDGLTYAKDSSTPFTGVIYSKFGSIKEYDESYSNGKLHGERIWYSSEEKPIIVEVYTNGVLNGTSYEYYENGATKTIKVYDNNKIVSMKSYNKAGNIIHDSTFTGGNGSWKIFWESEKVLEEGMYKNGVKDGEWKRYQSDGQVDNIKTYKDGKLIGESWN
ncbi:toxin-antitoxin system YwqK family antitoxin [Fusobacterium sp. PH5-44]|uniref:toxin-antitoxin system YwqK family antitoxin n=1 Tax=unclassified Fusobacterium TaxID=2648384 RepID=UPI003D1BD672